MKKAIYVLLVLVISIVCFGCATVPKTKEEREGVQPEEFFQSLLSGNYVNVKRLIEAGADVNAQTKMGATALMIALQYGHLGVAKLLIDEGADVNVQSKEGYTALMIASIHGRLEIAKLLIDQRADVNAELSDGFSALMYASQDGHTEVAKLLIEEGADVNAQSREGATALMRALQYRHLGVAELLVDKGADVNTQDIDGWTATMFASQEGQTKVAKILLEAGADVNIITNTGHTALMYASLSGHQEIAQLLREAGADVNTKTNTGHTALIYASQSGHEEIAQLLREAGAGLVAYYPFNGNANDESGNGNHGRLFGATLTSDRFGNPKSAYDFNGKNAYIKTPLDINISKMPELTMSVWVYPRRTGPEDEGVVSHGRRQILSCDDRDFDRSLMVRHGYWEIFMGGRTWKLTRVPVDIKKWQHVCVVFGASGVKFYKNGNVYSFGLFSGTGSTRYRLKIGDIPSPHAQFFDGIIDDVRIYNSALSSSEIQELYNKAD